MGGMNTRRSVLKGLAALLVLPALAHAQAKRDERKLIVYKNASCGCCGEWEKHMRSAGFTVETITLADVTPVKRSLGVPDGMTSCHTATISGYVIEGHVPAEDVNRLLRERPRAKGLAVPGMPSDAPGMNQGRGQSYQTLAFDSQRNWLFARH